MLAAESIGLPVGMLVTSGGLGVHAAHHATGTILIVMATIDRSTTTGRTEERHR